MRCSSLLAALLLVAALCHSEPGVSDLVAGALKNGLNATENYSVAYFGFNNESYGFVSYNGTETYIVKVNETEASVLSTTAL